MISHLEKAPKAAFTVFVRLATSLCMGSGPMLRRLDDMHFHVVFGIIAVCNSILYPASGVTGAC